MRKNLSLILLTLSIAGVTGCDNNKTTAEHTAGHQEHQTEMHDEHADKGNTNAAAGEEVQVFENASPQAQQEIASC